MAGMNKRRTFVCGDCGKAETGNYSLSRKFCNACNLDKRKKNNRKNFQQKRMAKKKVTILDASNIESVLKQMKDFEKERNRGII